MGRGDRRTAKGKRFAKSFGKTRTKKSGPDNQGAVSEPKKTEKTKD